MTKTIKRGKLIIIVAPSGSGKSTLINKLKADFPDIKESVSFTTRPKRIGDQDGKEYFFITREEFEEKIKTNDFIEWALVHGNYYGTSKSFIEKQLALGITILCDLDVQGADEIKKIFKTLANVIFISPPSLEELEKRLIARGTDSNEVIETRLHNAKKEILKKNDYDYLVVNDLLDRAYSDLVKVVGSIVGAKNFGL